MKTRALTRTHEGNTGGERHVMGVRIEDMPHVMSVLTDVYSDAANAVIREIACNGWDSHVAAGNTRPIKVSLPTQLDPKFVVQDFGVGMDEETVINQFSQYGWSSKRDSNTATGMLGIGCKSPLSYTGQFTLKCVKNGKQIVVLVTRDEQGVGAVEILDRMDTDAANGVTVTVPIAEPHSFNVKAWKFFGYWQKGTVLVDGIEPVYHIDAEKNLHLDDGVYLTPNEHTDIVVMGNVPYPVAMQHQVRSNKKHAAVVHVDIGAVDFAPSREALQYTEETLDLLATAREWIGASIVMMAQKEVDATPRHSAAYMVAQTWRQVLPDHTKLQWRNEQIPSWKNVAGWTWSVSDDWNGQRRPAKQRSFQSNQLTGNRWIVVTGFVGERVGAPVKDDVRRYIKEKGLDQQVDAAFFTGVFEDWYHNPDTPIISVQELRASRPKAPKKEKTKARFDVWGHGQVEELPDHHQIVVIQAWHRRDNEQLMSNLNAAVKREGSIMVTVRSNQEEKFLAAHKYAIKVGDYIPQAFRRLFLGMDPLEAYWTTHNSSYEFSASVIPPDQVEDPLLKEWLVYQKRGSSGVNYSHHNVLRRCSNVLLGKHLEIPPTVRLAEADAHLKKIQKRYPLAESGSSRHTTAILEYVNTLYQAKYNVTNQKGNTP